MDRDLINRSVLYLAVSTILAIGSFKGTIHDYGLLNPLANVPAVQSSLRFAAEELKQALK
jgi:hypothetical protein